MAGGLGGLGRGMEAETEWGKGDGEAGEDEETGLEGPETAGRSKKQERRDVKIRNPFPNARLLMEAVCHYTNEFLWF